MEKAHNGTILSMAWVDGKETLLTTCSTDRTVKVWDTSDVANIVLLDTLSPFDLDSKGSHCQQLVSVQAAWLEESL